MVNFSRQALWCAGPDRQSLVGGTCLTGVVICRNVKIFFHPKREMVPPVVSLGIVVYYPPGITSPIDHGVDGLVLGFVIIYRIAKLDLTQVAFSLSTHIIILSSRGVLEPKSLDIKNLLGLTL